MNNVKTNTWKNNSLLIIGDFLSRPLSKTESKEVIFSIRSKEKSILSEIVANTK